MRTSAAVFLTSVLCLTLSACNNGADSGPTTVSEAPSELAAGDYANATESISQMGIRARISFEDLTALISSELPETQSGTGSKRECKKVIGLKLCGTGQWNYTVERQAPPTITGMDDAAIIELPLKFYGTAGVKGDVAKALQLSKINFDGALQTRIQLKFDLDQNWCPLFDTEVTYQWTKSPRIEWAAGIKFNIRDQLDKAVSKQLDGLSAALNEKIDCEQFRTQITESWRSYTFPLQLTDTEQLYLNLEPTGFAFSGLRTEKDRFGVSFVLSAKTLVESTEGDLVAMPLPPLERVAYQPGATEFNVLLRLDYEQLQRIAAPELVGKTFQSSTSAGDVSVLIDDLGVSGTVDAIVLKIDFTADLPARRSATKGTLYLTSTPVADPVAQQVTLIDTKLSKVLDSTLWSVLSSVFENKIVAAIEQNAVIDLAPQLTELNANIQEQLSNPENTGGVNVQLQDLVIDLVNLIPEQQALAAEVKVAAQLDIDIPLQAVRAYRKK